MTRRRALATLWFACCGACWPLTTLGQPEDASTREDARRPAAGETANEETETHASAQPPAPDTATGESARDDAATHDAAQAPAAVTANDVDRAAPEQVQPSAAEGPSAGASSYGAKARAPRERNVGTAVLNPSEAQRSAGAAGEPLRALSDLPGVARPGFDSGELIVWGSAGDETRAYLDGVELPVLFHPGGFRSALPPSLLERMSITKGAPGPEFGRGLGGLIEVTSRDLAAAEPHAGLAVDTLDASGSLQGGVGPIQAAWGARLGYIDRLSRQVAPRAGDIVPVPEYADGFAKLQLTLSDTEQVTGVWLGTHDVWQRGTIAVDPAASRVQTQRRALQLGYVRYERRYPDRARVVVTPFVARYERGVVSRSGDVPWRQSVDEMRLGLRASYTLPAPEFDLQLGVDALAVQSQMARTGTLTLPPREGDITVFAQPPGAAVAQDRFATYDANVAPHVSVTLRWGRFTFTPGLRLEVYALTVSRASARVPLVPPIGKAVLEVHPEPRAALRYYVDEWLSFGARAAITHQQAAAEDRSAIFGDPQLGSSRALTIAAGPQVRPWRGLELSLTGFYKQLRGLAVRNPSAPLPLTQALVADGRGESYGAELGLQLRAAGVLSGQLSYTLSHAQRTDAAGRERLFDYDQTHLLTMLCQVHVGGFVFGARARLATGSPRTPVVGAFRNLADDRFEPSFGAHNAVRLPTFMSLDARLEHGFELGPLTGSLWLDVLNLTNQRNVEDLAYSFDYQTREDVTGLPILAVLGVSLQL